MLVAIFLPSLVLARSNVRQPTILTAHPYSSPSSQCLHIYVAVTTRGAWKQFCSKLGIKMGFEWTDTEQSVFTVCQVAGWAAASTDMRTDCGRGGLLYATARSVVELNKESIRDKSCSICEATLMTLECKCDIKQCGCVTERIERAK